MPPPFPRDLRKNGQSDGRGGAGKATLDYLLGARNEVMGTSVGAKRLFVVGRDVDDDVSLAYPTLRLVVGYAF